MMAALWRISAAPPAAAEFQEVGHIDVAGGTSPRFLVMK